VEHIQAHLEEHSKLWKGGLYSETAVILASMLGADIIKPDVREPICLICPCPGCDARFDRHLNLVQHMSEGHGEYIKTLYMELGPFWTNVIAFLKSNGVWPNTGQMVKIDMRFSPLRKEEADEMWAPKAEQIPLPKRFLSESMLDSILVDMYKYVSAEGVNRRFREIMTRFWNLNPHHTEEERWGQTFEELQRTESDWMSKRELILEVERKRMQEWVEQGESQQAAAKAREEEERARTQAMRTWIEETVVGEQMSQTEEEPREEEMRFWVPDASSPEELDESEHDEAQRREPTRRGGRRTGRGNKKRGGGRRNTRDRQQGIPAGDPWDELAQEWPEQVERARKLADILMEEDLDLTGTRLEEMLKDIRENPIPEERRKIQSWGDPLLVVLVQNRCDRICRDKIFCPHEGCLVKIRSVDKLMEHIKSSHKLHGEEVKCPDPIRYFIATMFEDILETTVWTEDGNRKSGEKFSIEKCYVSGCQYLHQTHASVRQHAAKQHKNNQDTNSLGWFWGTLRTIIRENPRITVREMFKDGMMYKCEMPRCGLKFHTEDAVRKHFAKIHQDHMIEDWESPCKGFRFITELVTREQRRQMERTEMPSEPEMETDTGHNEEERATEVRRPLQVEMLQRRQEPKTGQESGEEREYSAEEEGVRQQQYIRKRTEYISQLSRGVNIPKLDRSMMRLINVGLKDLFRDRINPLLRDMTPNPEEPDSWPAFEGAYEEAMDMVRRHIYQALGRNPAAIYRPRSVNGKIQKQREGIDAMVQQCQETRIHLCTIKKAIEEIAEGEGEEDQAEERRQRNRWTKKILPLLRMIPEEKRLEVFGSRDLEPIWQEMNSAPDHRKNVIGWLESLIVSEVAGEIEGISKQMQAQKVQEAYRTTKSIAMRRYIDKRSSPQCSIKKEVVEGHYRATWARPENGFGEAQPGSPLFLEEILPREEESEMKEFMLKKENIKNVIKSRQDLSACGPDGISYRIIKSAGGQGVKFMRILINASIECGKTITTWKQAKTILLHKKGDKNDVKNWRPISITNCIYRIFTCLMARCFQEANAKYGIYNDSQKGFIKKTNGCSEHGILLNELFQHAKRKNKSMIITAIDFTNAFGSVPHELIMSTMKQRNFPMWIQEIVRDMYTGATSTIELQGVRSEAIPWNKGVKQGCPLSPLLFNLCIEPLLQLIRRVNNEHGLSIPVKGDEKCNFNVQAYADDIIFISGKEAGIKEMLKTLQAFVSWSKMEVNAGKCSTASYMRDKNGRRCSLARNFTYGEKVIPNLTLNQSLKYLGTPVTAHRTVKLKAAGEKITEMEILLEKIMGSPLLTVQKIDAIKTFLLPCLDFLMLNGDVGIDQLAKFDRKIRGKVDEQLKIRGFQIGCHHMSWRDGGLSYPSLVDRRQVLTIRSFGQMALSQDLKIREVMEAFCEEERICRRIAEDRDGDFLNWKNERGLPGTASLIEHTRKVAQEMGLRLKISDSKLRLNRVGLEFQTTKATDIGRFLTQKVVRVRLNHEVLNLPLHGASFHTLHSSETSNKFLTNIHTKRSDAWFRFAVTARADCLPTPANIQRWYGCPEHDCHRCKEEGMKPTLAHILNQCKMNKFLFTKRHNKVVEIVRKAIIEYVGEELVSDIGENIQIAVAGLSEDVRALRPDLSMVRRVGDDQVMELVEISCPFGRISHERDTLEQSFKLQRKEVPKLGTRDSSKDRYGGQNHTSDCFITRSGVC
jgi:hypothetical protein